MQNQSDGNVTVPWIIVLEETEKRGCRNRYYDAYQYRFKGVSGRKQVFRKCLNKYCKFLPVPVVFGKKKEWKDGKYVDTEEDNQINDTAPAWTKKPVDLKDEDYRNFYHKLYPMAEDPLFNIHLNVDYPFNLTGILYFPKIKKQF